MMGSNAVHVDDVIRDSENRWPLASGNRTQALPLKAGWLVPVERLERLAAILSEQGFPELARSVLTDLTLLRWLAQLLERAVPEVARMNPLALIDAFERSLTDEVDFRNLVATHLPARLRR